MTADAVVGTRKSILVWLLTESGGLRGTVLSILALYVFFSGAISLTRPAITQLTTDHDIYLPANVQIVQDVKNILTNERGIQAIAIMQIESHNLEAYKKIEKDYPLHYLTIDTRSGGESHGPKVMLDYYAKTVTSTHIIHVSDQIASPPANSWGTYHPEGIMAIKNGKLIVPRNFHRNVETIVALLLLAAVVIALVLEFNHLVLSKWLRRIYYNCLKS